MRDARKDAEKVVELTRMFEAAENIKDEAEMSRIKSIYSQFEAEQEEEKAEEYWFMYRLFATMFESNNDKIVINDPYQYRDVERLVFWFRCNDVHEFVFASGWSSAMDTAWELTQAGCTMNGMVEVNTTHRDFDGNVEKAHGILFTM